MQPHIVIDRELREHDRRPEAVVVQPVVLHAARRRRLGEEMIRGRGRRDGGVQLVEDAEVLRDRRFDGNLHGKSHHIELDQRRAHASRPRALPGGDPP